MAQIRIDEITTSKSGKSWRVKAGNNWYGAGKDLFSEGDKGKTFDVIIEVSDFGPWINSAVDLAHTSSAGNKPTTATVEAPRGVSGGIPTFPTVAPFWMPFASNVVAHAISGGLVKTPTDIKAWVLAAKEAAEKAAVGDVSF